jgi:hypothetical protein
MPQEKPKKKKPLSNTPAGLGAKLGSAVRESFPLAASPAVLGAKVGEKVKGYMGSKKKKPIEHHKKSSAPKGFYWESGGLKRKVREKSDKG